jgi:hypothetical protein
MTANNPLRRAQIVSTFGIGAMVDFPRDESLMTAGLDAWPFARQVCPDDWIILEERLAARLGVNHFRLPPDFRDPGPGIRHPNQHIPFVRFPRWHYCPREGVMQYLPLFGASRERCPCRSDLRCFKTGANRRPFLIPVRIVAACERGHIQDFPFLEWVHDGQKPGADHHLRYVAGRSSASLSGIRIECSCGRSRSLAGSFDYDVVTGGSLHRSGVDCQGHRPWLGESDPPGADSPAQGCGQYLRVLQRGASNVYFPLTFSSIYLPLWGEGAAPEIMLALEDTAVWELLSSGLDEGRYISPDRCVMIARLRQIDPEALRLAAQRRLDGIGALPQPVTEEEYRRHEYEAIRDGRGGVNTDLFVQVRSGKEYSAPVADFLARVCSVRKLRETRAIAGFTRILPPGTLDNGASRDGQQIQPVSLGRDHGWLPAVVVRGEGVFLEFSSDAINRWLEGGAAKKRIAPMVKAYNARRVQRGQPPRDVNDKFVLLHSFAHVLIRQLSFDCGYGSASLRERIYCESSPGTEPMQGILIYTASGDSEGTMGGLVRQGDPGRLEATIAAGLRSVEWCSSDPVCLESSGQGIDNANLAACHGCVLLSETSCEEGNRLLDRALLIGSLTDSACGFFLETIPT